MSGLCSILRWILQKDIIGSACSSPEHELAPVQMTSDRELVQHRSVGHTGVAAAALEYLSIHTQDRETAEQRTKAPIDWFTTTRNFIFPALGGSLFGQQSVFVEMDPCPCLLILAADIQSWILTTTPTP